MSKDCTAEELSKALAGGCQLLDVRTLVEWNAGHVAGARHVPMCCLAEDVKALDKAKPVYVMCQKGPRSVLAARKLEPMGFTDVRVVTGGLSAWKERGLPVEAGKSGLWPVERQVRLVVGILLLTGGALARWVDPRFLYVSVFIGAGLTFAAVTDHCGMGYALLLMPWNRGKAKS